jgi:predicted HTH domain antitoxin
MILSLEVPDRFAHSLRLEGPQCERHALESLALEGYRAGRLSRGQVSELLELGFDETEAFLQQNGAYLATTAEELEQDTANLRRFLSR